MPPSESTREQIYSDVETVLDAIDGENTTYWTTPTVRRGLIPWVELAEDEFPAIMITEGDQEPEGLPSNSSEDACEIVIWVVVKVEDTPSAIANMGRDLNRLMQDVVTALEADMTRGGLVCYGAVEEIEGFEGIFTPFGVGKIHYVPRYIRTYGTL